MTGKEYNLRYKEIQKSYKNDIDKAWKTMSKAFDKALQNKQKALDILNKQYIDSKEMGF